MENKIRPVVKKSRNGTFHIGTNEGIALLVSIITLVLAFSNFFSSNNLIFGLVIGFVAHELAHKFVAQSLGYESEYRIWTIGLVLAIAFAIASHGRFIFAAPGYVRTHGHATIREIGMVSFSGPGANIIIAVLFLMINTPFAIGVAYVNIFLAGFNLLPIGPLDGNKVIKWNQTIWGASVLFCLIFGAFLFNFI